MNPLRWLANQGKANSQSNSGSSQTDHYKRAIDSNRPRSSAARRGGSPLDNIKPDNIPDRVPANIRTQYNRAVTQNREALNNLDKEAAKAIERMRQAQGGGTTGLNYPKGQNSSIGNNASMPEISQGSSRGGISTLWQTRIPRLPPSVSRVASLGIKGLGVAGTVAAVPDMLRTGAEGFYGLGHASLGAGLAVVGFLPQVRKQRWWQEAAQAWVDLTSQQSQGKRDAFMREILNPPSSEIVQEPQYPFTGGQSQNVLYNVRIRKKDVHSQYSRWGEVLFDGFINISATGPIVGMRFRYLFTWTDTPDGTRSFYYAELVARGGAQIIGIADGFLPEREIAQIVSCTRADGLPDTGGNPPPTTEGISSERPQFALATGYVLETGTTPAIEEPTTEPAEEEKPKTPYAPVIIPTAIPVPNSTTTPALVPTIQPASPANDPTDNPIYSRIVQETAVEEELRRTQEGSRPPSSESALRFPGVPIGTPVRNGSATGDKFKLQEKSPVTPTPQPTNCELNNACTLNKLGDLQNSNNQLGSKLDGINAGLNFADLLADLTLLPIINNKLGTQLPGGLSGFLQKAFRATRMDKVLNALNFILLLHNAAMLSRNLASTLGDLTSQALAVIGIKDENDSPIDINSILSKQADAFMKGLVGEEIWNGTKESWNKANRIIASATNIVWTIRSLGDSAREIAEWTAENTGKIGNALKRYRIVGEDAYKWMPENVKSTNKWTQRINRAMEEINTLDDAASSLSGVLSEVQNVGEEFGQLKEQRDTFKKQLEDLEPKEQKDNVPVKTTADARKEASVNPPEIANVERGQGEPVTSGT
jgi:hypothetical protein